MATETLVQRGGVESASTGGTKATVGLLRGDLEQVKRELKLAHKGATQELKEEAQETRRELKQEVEQTRQELKQEAEQTRQQLKQEARETRDELAVAAEAQGQRMAALEAKLEAVLELLAASR